MDDTLKTLLVIIGIFVALRALTFVMLAYRLLNIRVWPFKLSYDDEERPLPPDQLAAISELEELGFEKVSDGLLETGPYAYTIHLYKHKTEPAYAGVNFSLGSGITYPVAFYSFDKSGRILGTTNRLDWARMEALAGYEPQDAYATSLLEHWRAHKARLNGIETEDPGLNEVKARLKKLIEDTFPAMLAQKAIAKGEEAWHPTLKTALRLTLAFFKVRKKNCAPYNSKLMSDEHRSAYFTFCYQQMSLVEGSRNARAGVKSWFLALSVLAFYFSFRNYLTWIEGLILVGVVLVHELGHAAAMRTFGYRDITMFFIPFFGAMVTAKPKEPIATWKQAIILLAGPMPGLIFGLIILGTFPGPENVSGTFNWHDVGVWAAVINLVNLFPITPLDGGRLLEISLFKRWPYARLAFAFVSTAAFFGIALYLHDRFLLAVAVFLLLTIRRQWQIAHLSTAYRADLPEEERIWALFEKARTALRTKTFGRQYCLIKAVANVAQVRTPKLWETALISLFITILWGGLGFMLYRDPPNRILATETVDARSEQQKAFDKAFGYYRHDIDRASKVSELKILAAALDPSDPRRVDAEAEELQTLGEPERRKRLEALLSQGKNGFKHTIKNLATEFLNHVYQESLKGSPEQAAAILREAIDRVMHLVPNATVPVTLASLHQARATDRTGDRAKTLALLDRLQKNASDFEMEWISHAKTWFYISHGEANEALNALERSFSAEQLSMPHSEITKDYAWALLFAGRLDEGVQRMRLASYVVSAAAAPRKEAILVQPLDMAYALIKAGRRGKARSLINERTKWACGSVSDEVGFWNIPWQERYYAALKEAAALVCPEDGRKADAAN